MLKPIALAGFAASAPAVSAQDPAASDWTIAETRYGCSASRTAGEAAAIKTVFSRSFREPDKVELRIFKTERDEAGYTYGVSSPAQLTVRSGADDEEIGTGEKVVYTSAVRRDSHVDVTLNRRGEERFANGFADDAELSFTSADETPITISVEKFEIVQTRLDQCRDRLGLKLKNARSPDFVPNSGPQIPVPKTHIGLWVTSRDYPSPALRSQVEGKVTVDLQVDEFGLPAECTITRSSQSTDLDAAACRHLLRRAQFYPALSQQDEAVPGTWTTAVRWVMPN